MRRTTRPRWTVSIHAPAGGATPFERERIALKQRFRSTRPQGARLASVTALGRGTGVSIHAPAGGATDRAHHFRQQRRVSIHAPAGGATQPAHQINPGVQVSIHAPAGGATQLADLRARVQRVSIHAPAGGATRRHRAGRGCTRGFDPRARRGRDFIIIQIALGRKEFRSTRPQGARPASQCSIRPRLTFRSTRPQGARPAPDHGRHRRSRRFDPRARRGRDRRRCGCACRADGFDPRARRGRDVLFQVTRQRAELFRSTRPQGARRSSLRRPRSISSFRSTRPQGARHHVDALIQLQVPVSIHAPAGGATAQGGRRRRSRRCFDPRARRGRDRMDRNRVSIALAFRSTRPQGARPVILRTLELRSVFRSTRPQGARRSPCRSPCPSRRVSIHAPAGGATSSTGRPGRTGRGFDPRARRGRDATQPISMLMMTVFRSTRPQGARPVPAGANCRRHSVSIHAPAGGATGSVHMTRPRFGSFRSTRPQGARLRVS